MEEVKKTVSGNHVVNRNRPLTENELRSLVAVSNGRTVKEAANEIFLSPHTVKVQLAAVYFKLGANNSTHATAIAISLGIIKEREIYPGGVPLGFIKNVNRLWLERSEYNVVLDESVRFHLAEMQLIDKEIGPKNRSEWQLSGWLVDPCPILTSLGNSTLSYVFFPGRNCETGQSVQIRVVKHGKEYNLGLHVTISWPCL